MKINILCSNDSLVVATLENDTEELDNILKYYKEKNLKEHLNNFEYSRYTLYCHTVHWHWHTVELIDRNFKNNIDLSY